MTHEQIDQQFNNVMINMRTLSENGDHLGVLLMNKTAIKILRYKLKISL